MNQNRNIFFLLLLNYGFQSNRREAKTSISLDTEHDKYQKVFFSCLSASKRQRHTSFIQSKSPENTLNNDDALIHWYTSSTEQFPFACRSPFDSSFFISFRCFSIFWLQSSERFWYFVKLTLPCVRSMWLLLLLLLDCVSIWYFGYTIYSLWYFSKTKQQTKQTRRVKPAIRSGISYFPIFNEGLFRLFFNSKTQFCCWDFGNQFSVILPMPIEPSFRSGVNTIRFVVIGERSEQGDQSAMTNYTEGNRIVLWEASLSSCIVFDISIKFSQWHY